MVPSDWELKTVEQLFEVQLGKMLNKAAKERHPQYSYLGNSDVRWGYFDISELKSMYFSEKEKHKFTLKKGDILLCEGGEVGRCSIWNEDRENVFYQKALHRLRTKGFVIPEYFQSYMYFINGTKLLDNFTTKTSIAHLTREKLVKLPVKTPPLPEQRKIAKILSTWDKAITTNENLIEKSKLQKKALMQQLLTGKQRFAEFGGEWEEVRLGDIISHQKGFAFKSESYANEGVRIIRISDSNRNSIHDSNPVYINPNESIHLENYKLSTHDIILSTVGSRPHLLDSMVGKAIQIPAKDNGALLNQNLVKLKPKKLRVIHTLDLKH